MTERATPIDVQDQRFVRRVFLVLAVWTSLFLLASAGLVTYGDVLMELFA